MKTWFLFKFTTMCWHYMQFLSGAMKIINYKLIPFYTCLCTEESKAANFTTTLQLSQICQ